MRPSMTPREHRQSEALHSLSKPSRKEFLNGLGLLVLAAWGCGNGDAERRTEKEDSPEDADDGRAGLGIDETADEQDDDSPARVCSGDLTSTSSGATHTHSIMIPGADIAAGGTKKYETSSDFAHTHWIELTDADFAELRSGGTVVKTSCSGGDHSYELRCAEHVMTSDLPQGCNDECGSRSENVCG